MNTAEHILTNPIVAQFLGFIMGLFTSFFSWWVLFRRLTPNIALSDDISKSIIKEIAKDGLVKTRTVYKVQFVNIGFRTIIDFQLRAIIRIKGLDDPKSTVWKVAHILMREDGDKIYSYPNVDPFRRTKLRWSTPLHINSVESFKHSPYPDYIRVKAEEKSLLLEELLALGTAAEVRVIATGYDEFSGAKKIYEKIYFKDNVKLGRFKEGKILEVLTNMESNQCANNINEPKYPYGSSLTLRNDRLPSL